MRRILKLDGTVDKEFEPVIEKEELLKWYRVMITLRALNSMSFKLQRQGKVAFHVPIKGQEAHVGAVAALKSSDWVIPAYREHGVAVYRDYALDKIADHLFANEDDIQKGRRLPALFGDKEINFVNPSAPIGTQIIHAAGIGYAAKYKKDGNIALVFFGDGATSSNDFHSGMNFAGVFKTPTIFMCQNNHYAISLPVEKQTAAKNIVDKAVGYGMIGVQVDGNDVLAIYSAVKEAAEQARKGEGPTFIESVTYRLGAHTSSDDPTKYRSEQEVREWEQKDPIVRFEKYLMDKGYWTEKEEEKLWQKTEKLVSDSVKKAEKKPKPKLETMFDDVFEELPWHLKEQRKEALQYKEV